MLYLTLGIISALCFGTSNAYWKTATAQIPFSFVLLARGFIAATFFALLWLLFSSASLECPKNFINSANGLDYLKTVAVCLVSSLGLIFFLMAIKHTEISRLMPVSSINIFYLLTSVFVVGERFKSIYFASFVLSFFGFWWMQNTSISFKNTQFNKGLIYALMASFFWGISYPLFKYSSSRLGALPFSFILECCVTFSALIWIKMNKDKTPPWKVIFSFNNLRHYFILAALLIFGTLFYNLAIQKLSLLFLYVLNNLQIITSIFIGVFFLKERLSVMQVLGTLLILLSILLTQYFQ